MAKKIQGKQVNVRRGESVIRFERVSYAYGHNHPILDEVDFSVRRGMKVTVMGQNGAGKSTLFRLLTRELTPNSGQISQSQKLSVAMARQTITSREREYTVREFFEACFTEKIYAIDPKIETVLEIVHLHAPLDRQIKSFSGGQQARLLLASALIQDPDILLLDEPTNNLDREGIEHLTHFLKNSTHTCLVISHDADFLNAFTDGVLYLDARTRKIEQYVGNYHDLLNQITNRIEVENRKNAQLEKHIQENKDKVNFFAQKGGNMRLLAKKLRTEIEEMEDSKVDVRRDDKTIRPFHISTQPEIIGPILQLTRYTTIDRKTHKPKNHSVSISLRKKRHLLLRGPNGIGKSTLLESLVQKDTKDSMVAEGVRVGYYRQDFSTLSFEDSVYTTLMKVMRRQDEERMRSVASGFLITSAHMEKKIGSLSEGQKGLVAFAQLVLLEPGLLILDEPTNHINFRHIPIIAKALDQYEGAMILVSHVPDFVAQIRIDETLDLER